MQDSVVHKLRKRGGVGPSGSLTLIDAIGNHLKYRNGSSHEFAFSRRANLYRIAPKLCKKSAEFFARVQVRTISCICVGQARNFARKDMATYHLEKQ